MKKFRLQLRSLIDQLLGSVVILCFTALVLDVLWGILSRYFLRSQSPWTDELATTLMIWIALLGAASAYGERRHLGLDILFSQLHPKIQIVNAIVADLIVASFAVTIMLGGGWFNVHETLQANQLMPALGWHKGYVYLAMPVSGALILYYSLDACWSRVASSATDCVTRESEVISSIEKT